MAAAKWAQKTMIVPANPRGCDIITPIGKPRAIEFIHKVKRKALQVDGWSTSGWAKARVKFISRGSLQFSGSNGISDRSQHNAIENGSRRVGTARADIGYLKNRLEEGISTESETFVRVLQMCLRQKDLSAGKQVHACIIQSRMDKDPSVANSLLNLYIKCGQLSDARRVFDELDNKSVITWTTMIAAYAKFGHCRSAFEVLNQMHKEGPPPDKITYLSMLKACGNPSALKLGKQVHLFIRNAGFESGLQVGTALVQMYGKCGCIAEARQLFDKMEKRDVFLWNIMIGGLAQQGCGHEAYRLFLQMKREGFKPDAYTYASIFKASASAETLKWVKEVHGHASNDGLESDLRVGTALIRIYAKSGCIDDARTVFDRMEKRDLFTWNTMIGGLAQHGWGHDAYRLFLQMRREGFKPDAYTFASIFSASAGTETLKWVKEVHCHAKEAGFESNLRVANALINIYAKSGSIDDSRIVFDRMNKRDIFTWNTMIDGLAQHGWGHDAYKLFLQMKREGFKPDAYTYASIFNASPSAGALEWVKEIHGYACKEGLESDLRVANALIHLYAKIGSIDDARIVFDRMEKRDLFTWNTMISGLAQCECGHEAYRLFLQMRREGLKPDAYTYASIFNASASVGALEWSKEVHGIAREAGFESNLRVANALIHMYARSGSINDARIVFDRMEKRDLFTWNTMINGLAQHESGNDVYKLFLQMKREGFTPDAYTYASIFNASASAEALEWVKEVHCHASKAGLESDLRVGNALIHMYAKSGSIDDARIVFDKMEKQDVITWSTMIGGLAQHGCGHEALGLFRKMKSAGVKPNQTTFTAVLSACCHAGLLDEGSRLFLSIKEDYFIEPEIEQYNCMVDLLGRAGQLEEAKIFIGDMPVEPNAVTWKALLGACRTYGNVELGELAAQEFFKLEPNEPAGYVLLSNIYAAAGEWEKVALVRTMMQARGVRKEPGRSWITVDNRIHEFVVGDTSHPEASAIYTYLKTLTQKLKAEGYIPDTGLVLQNIDEEEKELALCSHSEKLAIAYGLMRIPRGQPIRIYKNLRVCPDCHTATKFISKVTGHEIIARDANRFHHFKNGKCSCGDFW